MTAVALRPLSLGEILDAAFQVYRRHFGALATIVLVCNGLPMLLQVYNSASGGTHWLLSLTTMLLGIVLSLVATGASVFVVSESYLGRSITAREALMRSMPFVWPLILVSVAVGLLAFLGFLLLVVPGLIAVCGLAVAIPALVVETLNPNAALGRSWDLTRGYRLRMLGLFIIIFILLVVPYLALMGVFTALGAMASAAGGKALGGMIVIMGVVIAAIVQLLLSPLYQAALVVAYYDLRVRKEGFDLEILASSLRAA